MAAPASTFAFGGGVGGQKKVLKNAFVIFWGRGANWGKIGDRRANTSMPPSLPLHRQCAGLLYASGYNRPFVISHARKTHF